MRTKKGNERNSTELAISAAAEELFLENGYNLTTTTMIAQKAGVTHAMLHYYFRTKEHIFVKVLDRNPFWESLETGISTHFDFLMKHPKLPAFLYDTVRFNPELIENYKGRIRETVSRIIRFHYNLIQEEIDKGRICRIDPLQLVLDIATLNLSAFMMIPAAGKLFGEIGDGRTEEILKARKAEIIALIRARLYGGLEEKEHDTKTI